MLDSKAVQHFILLRTGDLFQSAGVLWFEHGLPCFFKLSQGNLSFHLDFLANELWVHWFDCSEQQQDILILGSLLFAVCVGRDAAGIASASLGSSSLLLSC